MVHGYGCGYGHGHKHVRVSAFILITVAALALPLAQICAAFRVPPQVAVARKPCIAGACERARACVGRAASASTSAADVEPSWQEQMDKLLSFSTPCSARAAITRGLLQRSSEIAEDVTASISSRNISRLAPSSTEYGKAIAGVAAVRNQVVTDLIPEALEFLPQIPDLLPKIPTLTQDALTKAPEFASSTFEKIRALAQDPDQVAELAAEARQEMQNVITRTPAGLETPAYTVETVGDGFEIRSYETYSVCVTATDPNLGMMDPRSGSRAFQTLANYIFGDNSQAQKMSMTSPVATVRGRGTSEMYFVLPSSVRADAPLPSNPSVSIREVPAERVAAREFPGLATEGEVMRQRTALEIALANAGIAYNSETARVFQYNPPYTLPWLRKNELIISLATVLDEVNTLIDLADAPSDTDFPDTAENDPTD